MEGYGLDNGIGEGRQPSGQCRTKAGAGRGQVRGEQNDDTKKSDTVESWRDMKRTGIARGTHPQASAGQADAFQRGIASEDQPPNGLASEDETRGVPIAGEEATRHRAMVASFNFLRCDWPDIQYSANAASRWAPMPCRGDDEMIAWIGKQLLDGLRRMEQCVPFGRNWSAIRAYPGSDRVETLRPRKSTSGGVLCI